jgi:TolA-binding protein
MSDEALVQAAEQALVAGRPAVAATLYRRVAEQRPPGGLVGLAAYRLGQVLCGALAQPAEGARVLARMRAADPRSPLAEEALVREVECRSQAADRAGARALAQEYLQRYPEGAHRARVLDAGAPE